MALTNKQQAFINEYLQCWNGAEAARRAGYSERTAGKQAWQMLQLPAVKTEIEERLEEHTMSANEVLVRLTRQARADIGDYLVVYGGNIDIDLVSAKEAHETDVIKKLTHRKKIYTDSDGNVTEDIHTQIELHDQQAAAVHLGRHYALFTDRVENRNLDIDLSNLTDAQLQRVADGEDVLQVVLDGYLASS